MTDISDAVSRMQSLNAILEENERLRSEIARLRDELQSTTRHMELAEAAWLRETAGNSPVAVVLTDAERKAVANMIHLIETRHEDYGKEAHYLRNLLERTQ